MDVLEASPEVPVIPGQEPMPLPEASTGEPDAGQLAAKVTDLEAQVKVFQAMMEQQRAEAAAELARQREMFKTAMAQSDKLAQEELDKRIAEHMQRETTLSNALFELQQALGQNTEQQGDTVIVKLPKVDWAQLLPKTSPALGPPPPAPPYNPRKRGRPTQPLPPPQRAPQPSMHLVSSHQSALIPQHHMLPSPPRQMMSSFQSQMMTSPMMPSLHQNHMLASANGQGQFLLVPQTQPEEAHAHSGEEEEARDMHKDSKKCRKGGCDKYASYSYDTEYDRTRMYCKAHKKPGMVNRKNKRCQHVGCTKGPVMSFPGDKKATRCKAHMLKGMVDVINKRCKFEGGCNIQPSYGFAGERPSRCKEHMLPGMGNTRSKLCIEPDCQIRPLFGYWGETAPSRCKAHSLPGQTNILHLQCAHPTCHQRPVLFGLPDDPKPKRCAQHSLEGMIDFRQKLQTSAPDLPVEEQSVLPVAQAIA